MEMTGLPEKFVEMTEALGLRGLAEVLAGSEPSTAVRMNRDKWPEGVDMGRRVEWCESGRYPDVRRAFIFDPMLHQGAYYVQDASSMIMSHVARKLSERIGRPLAWLDACAAPGGKSSAAISELPEGSVLVANEYVAQRAAILSENLAKWGNGRAVVTTGDAARFGRLGERFDVIAADVPCSGEGMMRKDSDAVAQWSEGLIEECARRQWEIVSNLWNALRGGGYLIYSTCTFNRRENEEIVERIVKELGGEAVDLRPEGDTGISEGIDTPYPAMRFIPGRTEGEGLFMAVVRKPGTLPGAVAAIAPKKKSRGSAAKESDAVRTARGWLKNPDDYKITVDAQGIIRALPASVLLPREIADNCRPVLTLGSVKGRDVIPAQALALSTDLRREAFGRADVDRATALTYLRHESITLGYEAPKGIVLLYYRDLPLGFVKNLGKRANNLYPAPWRILSALPDRLPAELIG